MDRLKSTYGVKSYPDERVEVVFREVGSLPSHELELIVTELIGTNRHAPMLDDIRKQAADVKKRYGDKRELSFLQTNEGDGCKWCDKKGFILAQSVALGSNFVFSCGCKYFLFYSWPYPQWNESLLSDYKPDYLVQISLPKTVVTTTGDEGGEVQEHQDSD